MRKVAVPGERPLLWVGPSKKDLLTFPDEVIDAIGTALSVAQFGGMHPAAKLWKGQGSGVVEIVEDFNRATFRAVYTVRFEKAVYVLHCFQKKSPTGIKTAKQDVDLIRQRLKDARADYEVRYGSSKK
jgi:phage-related protein